MDLKLRYLLNEISRDSLKEILDFDGIEDLEFKKLNPYEYTFQTNDRLEGYVQFEHFIGDELNDYKFQPLLTDKFSEFYNSAFSVDGVSSQAKESDLKYYYPILKVITKINHQFISEIKPDCLTIFTDARDGSGLSDSAKDRIFKLMAQKHPASGYGMSSVNFIPDNKDGFCLYKISTIKKLKEQKRGK